MSALESIRTTLSTVLQDGLATRHPTIPISFENQRTKIDTNGVWIKASVIPNIVQRADLGSNNNFKAMGVVSVQIMSPEEGGTRPALEVVDSVLAILLDRSLPLPGGGSVTLYTAEINSRGVMNGWHAYAVVASYRAYVTVARD